ncbi:STYL1 protein, partial [Polypterus senegalus]|nr:STYL1 protein [Polypterus senegalus]
MEQKSQNPVHILKGGYESFSALYPFLRTMKIMYTPQELESLLPYPVEILPCRLYMGDLKQAENPQMLKDLKIKAQVNVSGTTPNVSVKGSSHVLDIKVSESTDSDLSLFFQENDHFRLDTPPMTMAGEVTYSTLDFSQAGANTAAKPPGNCEDVTYSHVNFKTSTINQDGTPAAPSNGASGALVRERETKTEKERCDVCYVTVVSVFTKKAMTSTNDTSCKMVTELQDCQSTVTLNSALSHCKLILSINLTRVQNNHSNTCQAGAQNFDYFGCAPGNEGFTSGKHYWDVHVGNSNLWRIGVITKSAERRNEFLMTNKRGYWVIRKMNNNYTFFTDKENKLNLNYQPNKIRLYLDHEKKQLSLCAMDNNSINAHIYTFEDINTSEKLFPIICTGDTKVITINPSSKT